MKYPKEIFSAVRTKTFAIEAHLFQDEDSEKPLQVLNSFSRFIFTIIDKSKAISANVPVELLQDMKARTQFAVTKHFESVYANAGNVPASPAFTEKFNTGNLKGLTPADVLKKEGENGKKVLNDQYKWLKQNLKKYPANQKLIDAIIDAANLEPEMLEGESSYVPTIDILTINCRPLIRKKRESDGMCPCYEVYVKFDSSKNYQVSVNIQTYYAPVEKRENGTLNVMLAKKDKNSIQSHDFAMTLTEWLNALHEMQEVVSMFKICHFSKALKQSETMTEELRNGTAAGETA